MRAVTKYRIFWSFRSSNGSSVTFCTKFFTSPPNFESNGLSSFFWFIFSLKWGFWLKIRLVSRLLLNVLLIAWPINCYIVIRYMCMANSTQELVGIHNLRQSQRNNQLIAYHLPVCYLLRIQQYPVNTTHNS